MVESPLMTIAEAAALFRVDHRTVRRMCERGDLPAVRIGRQWRIDTSEPTLQRQPRVHGDFAVNGSLR